jgi:hypothetical protein
VRDLIARGIVVHGPDPGVWTGTRDPSGMLLYWDEPSLLVVG